MDQLSTAQTADSISIDFRVPPKRPRGRPRKTVDERDAGNRRQALLSAAAKLFRRKGFAATSTRDIAAAVGMHSGSPFYHFDSKGALLFAVMEAGMRAAIAAQAAALEPYLQTHTLSNKELSIQYFRGVLAILMRNHLSILLGKEGDFVPVMLYEFRSLNPHQQQQIKGVMAEYEAAWCPVLQALRDWGQLSCEVKIARLLIFGALNWTTQWFDPQHMDVGKTTVTLDDIAAAAMALFLEKP
jgi:TetR/AcrR family transcriptional regulator, cholesterol catabolism regulator